MDRDRIGATPAIRRCARPGCSSTAAATLAYDYKAREVWLSDLGESTPATHDLCATHAERLQVPRGWERHDLRELRRPMRSGASTERAEAEAASEGLRSESDSEGGSNLRLAV